MIKIIFINKKVKSIFYRKIYIETKLSPNVVNKLIQKLVNKYNIDQRDYKIYYQNEKSVSKEDKKIS